jgi:serine protease Do
VNYNGQVIGINSAKNAEAGFEGMGFAIPITDALPVIQQLIEKGYASHPGLLVSIDNRYTPEWAAQQGWPAGAYVSQVSAGGPADKAGIRAGDVLVKINDVTVKSSLELTHELFKYKSGDTVTVSYYRNGETKDVKITLVELKPQ